MLIRDLPAIEDYLHRHIPLSRAMAVTVETADESGIRLSAPLDPNINHCGTAFGGSVSALAILSAWILLHTRLTDAGSPAKIVIQHNEVAYLQPVTGNFSALCPIPDATAWHRFLTALQKKGKARIHLSATLWCGPLHVGHFSGDYVALLQKILP